MKNHRVIYVVLAVFLVAVFALSASQTVGQSQGDKMAQVFFKEIKPPEDLLPPGVRVVEGFQPGPGAPIGTIEKVTGSGLIVHKGQMVAYRAKRRLELFEGDSLITGERSRMQLRMNDRSVMALAPWSKLSLDKSTYNPVKDRRESFVNMIFGRARFIVQKLKAAYHGDYKIKTANAVCGLIGSDLAVSVVPQGEETLLRPNWFARLNLVDEAWALAGYETINVTVTYVTAEGTVATVQGVLLVPESIMQALADGTLTGVLPISLEVLGEVLGAVGPGLAILEMPPDME